MTGSETPGSGSLQEGTKATSIRAFAETVRAPQDDFWQQIGRLADTTERYRIERLLLDKLRKAIRSGMPVLDLLEVPDVKTLFGTYRGQLVSFSR